MKGLKRTFIILVGLFIAGTVYVLYANRNAKNMTPKQKFLKAVYPAWMWFTQATGKNNSILKNEKGIQPAVSFYSLHARLNNGNDFDFSQLKGKKVLIVNTASDCGYTNQYDDLQKLYEQQKEKLIILGFPANDFKEQEKGSDEEIAQFCRINFGVSFPLMQKSVVIRSGEQNEVFRWLSDPAKNGWNKRWPVWNFSKYLINENGVLINYFDPSVSPLSKEVISAINKTAD